MKILGIETSCDETGISIVEQDKSTGEFNILSNTLATSLGMHAMTGGIIPENAAREQLKYIIPTLRKSLADSLNYTLSYDVQPDIDAIAVTYGPGLIGSLLVGVETARTLSYMWGIPIIPINHMHGHIYANFIGKNQKAKIKNQNEIEFPAIALVVSGGHTDLLYMKDAESFEVIGGTRDDAAGEAFDKIGRLLGLDYPAGAVISKLAESGNPKAFNFPRPMIGSPDFDFSFSGLKASVMRLVHDNGWDFSENKNQQLLSDICASAQEAIVDVISKKTIKAAVRHNAKSILLGGGVAANDKLQERLKLLAISHPPAVASATTLRAGLTSAKLFVPTKSLCTDNGAMIAAAGFFQNKKVSWQDVTADPELYY